MAIYFPKLSEAVSGFAPPLEIQSTIKDLELGKLEIEGKDIIAQDNGLFVYKNGYLIPVAVHINTYNLDGHYCEATSEQKDNIEQYCNDELLVMGWHKVHFANCNTLQGAVHKNTNNRFKATHRKNGKFYYIFANNNAEKFISENQDLLMCKYCIEKIRSQYNKKYETNISRHTIQEIRTMVMADFLRFDCGLDPNLYSGNWSSISRSIKERNHWKCQGAGCDNQGIDFSLQDTRKYLHTHHINMNKKDNSYINLKTLCIECHARQHDHGHIKGSSNYTEFSQKFFN